LSVEVGHPEQHLRLQIDQGNNTVVRGQQPLFAELRPRRSVWHQALLDRCAGNDRMLPRGAEAIYPDRTRFFQSARHWAGRDAWLRACLRLIPRTLRRHSPSTTGSGAVEAGQDVLEWNLP
jgi:hypothetical protein